jgi:hypothetical protein
VRLVPMWRSPGCSSDFLTVDQSQRCTGGCAASSAALTLNWLRSHHRMAAGPHSRGAVGAVADHGGT